MGTSIQHIPRERTVINQVRTLLLNRGRDGQSLMQPGEEYIPADFVPRVVPQQFVLLRSMLFGTNPDRLFLNYRMRQLMQLIHSTPLAQDVLADDPRITYLPFKDDLFQSAFKATITQTAGPAWPIDVRGEYVVTSGSSLMRQLWTITVGEAGTVTVTKRRGVVEQAVTVVVADTPVSLPSSTMQVYLHNAPAGCTFQIEVTARPVGDLGSIMSGATAVVGNQLDTIFPTITDDTSPLATWKQIWLKHPDNPMKYAAMLLAMAYRIGQMPQVGGTRV